MERKDTEISKPWTSTEFENNGIQARKEIYGGK